MDPNSNSSLGIGGENNNQSMPEPDKIYGSDTQVAQPQAVVGSETDLSSLATDVKQFPSPREEKMKSWFVRILISLLIGAATIAVVAVLIGDFSDTLGKALGTLVLMALHASLALSFALNNEKRDLGNNFSTSVFSVFTLLVISFVTSIFWIWGIIDGPVIIKTYGYYLILLFATVHSELLAKTLNKRTLINNIVYANYVLMAIVVVMLAPVVYASDTASLNDLYLRILSASAIVDATLTIIVMILYKAYLDKHPEVKSILYRTGSDNGGGMNILLKILFVYLFFQFGLPILYFILAGLGQY